MAGVKGALPESKGDRGRTDPDTGRRIGKVFSLATFEAFRAHHAMLTEVFAFTRCTDGKERSAASARASRRTRPGRTPPVERESADRAHGHGGARGESADCKPALRFVGRSHDVCRHGIVAD